MKRLGLLALAASTVLLLTSAASATSIIGSNLSLTVYADGYVHVSQTFSVDPREASVQVPLLSEAVSDLVATDQNGSPLSYGFAPGGGNLTVYTLGANSLTLRYDTNSLTSKNGTVWTLAFGTAYNSTVILPPLSTLTFTSGTPFSINDTGGSPELTLPAGSWQVSYGVPFGGATSTSSGTAAQSNPVGTSQLVLGAMAISAAAIATALFLRRRMSGMPGKGDLRPDDIQVLNFIREKGGRVLEPEIRTKFALPKTSAWRQIKRLERLGYVRVTKIGSQNQIEILKEGPPGS